MSPEKLKAYEKLNIKKDNKVILSLDGGGIRGILTLQLLKKLEEIAEAPCYKWCDMLAGTSTGGIIAGLIFTGHSAKEIENEYIKLVSQVFTKRNFFSDRYVNPPMFDKKNYRRLLKSIIGDVTLSQASINIRDKRNGETGLDLLITSKDMAAGEETYFTCFKNGTIGTYKDVLLRGVMEATMSAPTYFLPFERFIDGGTTTFNNPVGPAVLEALNYNGKDTYKSEQLTVFSFGTGTSVKFIAPNHTGDPKGIDLLFWLDYVLSESSKDASEMQVDVLRSGLLKDLDFRRFQISFDEKAIWKLPDLNTTSISHTQADSLHQLTDEELAKIDMSDVLKFDLVKIIGEAMANYICSSESGDNWFKKDLINSNGRGQLVTARGSSSIGMVAKNLSDASWIDSQPTA